MVEILTQQISDRENENKLSRLQDRIKLDKLEQQITEALILNPGIDLYQDPNLSSVVRERNELVSKQHKLVPDEQIDNMRAILDERARLDSEIKSANALISQLEESLRVAQSNEISVGAIWDLRNTIRNLETRLERENLSTSERDLIQQDIEKLKSQYTNLLKESNENQSFIFNAQLDSANAKQNLLESSQRAAELEKQYQNTFNPQEYLEAANKRAAVASQLKTSQQEYTGVSSALRDAQSRRAQQGTVSTPARESAPKIPLKPLDQNAVSEIRDLYPKNILRAVGVNNIATLPVVNIKRTLYEDDSDSLYPSTKPLTAHEMAPYKAVRGVDSEGRPFISYINEQSVACTLFPLNKNDMNWSSVQSIRVPNARQDIEPYSMDANQDRPVPLSASDLNQLAGALGIAKPAANATPNIPTAGFQTQSAQVVQQQTVRAAQNPAPTAPSVTSGLVISNAAPITPAVSVTPAPSDPKLICIDFNETITATHVHGTLSRNTPTPILENGTCIFKNGQISDPNNPNRRFGCTTPQEEAIYKQNAQQIAETVSLKEPEKMCAMIRHALKTGNKVAITSFNRYPDAIPKVLERAGLTEQEIAQVTIVVGYPSEGSNSSKGKQEHMELAAQMIETESNIIIPKQNTMLIDDSTNNVRLSQEQGYAQGLVIKPTNNQTDFTQVDRFTTPAPRSSVERLNQLLDAAPVTPFAHTPFIAPTPLPVTHDLKTYQSAQPPLAPQKPDTAPTLNETKPKTKPH